MDRDKLKAMLKHCEDYNSKYDGEQLEVDKLADYLHARGYVKSSQVKRTGGNNA